MCLGEVMTPPGRADRFLELSASTVASDHDQQDWLPALDAPAFALLPPLPTLQSLH